MQLIILFPLFIFSVSYFKVFIVRFTNAEDKAWFEKSLNSVIRDIDETLVDKCHEEPYFVDFLRDAPEPTGEEADDAVLDAPKIYEQVQINTWAVWHYEFSVLQVDFFLFDLKKIWWQILFFVTTLADTFIWVFEWKTVNLHGAVQWASQRCSYGSCLL